jgi:hypothetical protein
MNPTPYMEVVENPRRMAGKGAPRDTTFGVLGHTKETTLTRSLGGLVKDTKSGPKPPHFSLNKKGHRDMSEHHIASGNKTEIPGVHMGQVPYPGVYMKMVGAKLK